MNVINSHVANAGIPIEKTPLKSQSSPEKTPEPGDSFSASKTSDNHQTYSPKDIKAEEKTRDIKTGEKPGIKFTDRLKGLGRETLAGIGLGLAAGGIITAVGGVLGAAIFGVGGILVGAGPIIELDALIGFAGVTLAATTGLFGTIGAVAGFVDPLSDEAKKSATPSQVQAKGPTTAEA